LALAANVIVDLAGTHDAPQIGMNAEGLYHRSPSVSDAENWLALGAGALLFLAGASRRSPIGACLAVSSAPLLYRGITGRRPDVLNGHTEANGKHAAVGGARGIHVRESVRREVPVAVYGGWLDKFPLGAAFAKGLTLERGEIDPSFIITHRIWLEDAPAMYRTFRDKDDSCIKVVIKPGAAAHTDKPTSVHP